MSDVEPHPGTPVPAPRSLVIGFGSIGSRHARLLGEMGHAVAVVSRRPEVFTPSFPDLSSALAGHRPDYVVVANETSRHHDTLRELADLDFSGSVLVEKPLWNVGCPDLGVHSMRISVGYVLRFMPAMMELKRRLGGRRILSAEIRACSYLPDWRPGRDYRTTASALRESGGGALRDLSHDLDYLLWLVGPWRRLSAVGGRRSDLEIETDDLFMLLGETTGGCVFSVSLNYLDHVEERWIVVNTDRETYRLDLVSGALTESGRLIKVETAGMDALYTRQHQAAIGGAEPCCTLTDGAAVVDLIAAAEQAALQGRWIER